MQATEPAIGFSIIHLEARAGRVMSGAGHQTLAYTLNDDAKQQATNGEESARW